MKQIKITLCGLRVLSEIPLLLPPSYDETGESWNEAPDVVVRQVDKLVLGPDVYQTREGHLFRITHGNFIEVVIPESCSVALTTMYLIGEAMRVILTQRRVCLFHGACVEKGNNATLIIGESGAGKSTLAHGLINHGWRMQTDDMTAVTMDGDDVFAYSSFPCGKLWISNQEVENLSIAKENLSDNPWIETEKYGRICFIYHENGRSKFFIDLSQNFQSDMTKITNLLFISFHEVESDIIQWLSPSATFSMLLDQLRNRVVIAENISENSTAILNTITQLTLTTKSALYSRNKSKVESNEFLKIILNHFENQKGIIK